MPQQGHRHAAERVQRGRARQQRRHGGGGGGGVGGRPGVGVGRELRCDLGVELRHEPAHRHRARREHLHGRHQLDEHLRGERGRGGRAQSAQEAAGEGRGLEQVGEHDARMHPLLQRLQREQQQAVRRRACHAHAGAH